MRARRGCLLSVAHFAYRPPLLLLCLALLLPAHAGRAAVYPIRPVTLLAPHPTGSQSDAFFSLLLPFLRKHAGSKEISLELKPGRGGGAAWAELSRRPGDGYALAALYAPTFFLQARAKDRLYDERDIAPVAVAAYAPLALWVNAESPLNSVADVIAHARAPGGRLVISGTGSYTDQHMASLLFDRAAGVKSLYLPYLGSTEAAKAVQEGTAQACWGYALPGASMPGMRPLAVAAQTRRPALPDVPTFAEAGTPLNAGLYIGLCLPASTGEETRQQVSELFIRAASDPEFAAAAALAGFQPRPLSYHDMPAFIAARQGEVDSFAAAYPMFK